MSEKKYLIQEFEEISASQLLGKVRDLKESGHRLGQVCATTKEDGYEILYSFDKDYVLKNLRLKIGPDEEVESVTKQYWSAFIYENEMHDLFGIKFLHNELDYGGKFFKTAEPTPWKIK